MVYYIIQLLIENEFSQNCIDLKVKYKENYFMYKIKNKIYLFSIGISDIPVTIYYFKYEYRFNFLFILIWLIISHCSFTGTAQAPLQSRRFTF